MMFLPEQLVNVLTGLEPVTQYPSVLVLLGVCIPCFIFPALTRFLPKRLVSLLTGREPFPGIPMTKNARLVSGHSYLFARNFRETWRKLTESSNEDGICSFWMGWKPVCVVTDIENARKILLENTAKSATKHTKHMKMFVSKTAVIFLEDPDWEPRHLIFKDTLADTVGTIHKPIHGVASKIVSSLIDGLPQQGGSPMNGHDLAKTIFSTIVGNVFLNFKFDKETDAGNDTFVLGKRDPVAIFLLNNVPFLHHRCTASNWNPLNYFYFLTARSRQFLTERTAVRKVIMDMVKSEMAEGKKNDSFIGHLITAARASGDMATEEDLVGFVLTAYFGSLDTTSNTFEYILYHLAKAPDVVEKCLEEIASLKKIKRIEDIDPNDCVYITAVVNETLRINPIAVSAWRKLKEEMTMGKTTIPAGTQVYFPLHTIARNYAAEKSETEFSPERWVKRSTDGSGMWERSNMNPNDFSNLTAFSHGRRSCPGKHLARKGLITLLVHLLPAVKIELEKEDYVVKPALNGIVQSPEGGVPLKISRRL